MLLSDIPRGVTMYQVLVEVFHPLWTVVFFFCFSPTIQAALKGQKAALGAHRWFSFPILIVLITDG